MLKYKIYSLASHNKKNRANLGHCMYFVGPNLMQVELVQQIINNFHLQKCLRFGIEMPVYTLAWSRLLWLILRIQKENKVLPCLTGAYSRIINSERLFNRKLSCWKKWLWDFIDFQILFLLFLIRLYAPVRLLGY